MTNLRRRYDELLEASGLSWYPKRVREEGERFFKEILKGAPDERLRHLAATYPNADLFGNLQALFKLLELRPLRKDIFFGFFPTPTLNAETVNLGPEGYLVLIHGGLFALIVAAVKAVVFSSPTDTGEGRILPPLIPPQKAAETLADVVISLKKCQPRSRAVDPLPRSLSELAWTTRVFDGTVTFIMTHEYAHANLGHLESLPAVHLNTPQGYIKVNERRVEQEWAADRKALDLILNKIRLLRQRLDPEEEERAIYVPSLMAGPMAVLMLSSWVESGTVREVTHPPPTERLLALDTAFKTELGETIEYRRAWNFVSHLEALGNAGGLTDSRLFVHHEPPAEDTFLKLVQSESGIKLEHGRKEDHSLD